MLRIREATPEDLEFLEAMFVAAARVSSAEALRVPELARYFEEWGRESDVALIAEEEVPVGAAWWRFLRGYGFVSDDVPELGIAVADGHRGRGIGMHLLRELQALAAARGLPGLSLSVHKNNPARALYTRAGFADVGASGEGITMFWRVS